MQTLVLNHSYQPIQIVGWEKAIYLLLTGKAELVLAYEKIIRSVSIQLSVPKVLRLKRYFKQKVKSLTNFSKRAVFQRDDWMCQYCLIPLSPGTATLDHVLPRSKGGETTWVNSVACCFPCNQKKRNRTPEEARMTLNKKPLKPEMQFIDRELKVFYEDYLKEFMP